MREPPLTQRLQRPIDGGAHGADLVGEPGAQHGQEIKTLLLCDVLQHHELDLAVDGLQPGPNPFRLPGLCPLGEPAQEPLHPELLDPRPALGGVVEQGDVAVVLDAQPAVVDAPIDLAPDLIGGEVPEAPVVVQLIPLPLQGLLAAGAVEDQRDTRAPGLSDDAVGGHEHGVDLVLRRGVGRQDEGYGVAGTATAGHVI